EDFMAYDQAMIRAWRRDYRAAGALLEERIAAAQRRHAPGSEVILWNTLTWVRWAGGDLDGAIASNENLQRLAREMGPDDALDALGHYWWDRAYLYVDKDLATAEDARRPYSPHVAARMGASDPVHVLACYFAWRAGDLAAAVKEADQVSEAWPDLQDAYVMLRAYELAGDTAKADRLKRKLQRGTYIMVPIYLQ